MVRWVGEVVVLCMGSMLCYLRMGKCDGVGRESWRRAHVGQRKTLQYRAFRYEQQAP